MAGDQCFLAGTYELTIDLKHRLQIPSAVAKRIDRERDGKLFYCVPGRRRGTLALYPEKTYEHLRADLPADDALSDDAYAYRQFESSQSALLDPDGQGRVLIPDRLLQRAGIGKDVVLIAVQDHLELWNRADFEAFENGIWFDYPERRTRAFQEMKAIPTRKDGENTPGCEPPGTR